MKKFFLVFLFFSSSLFAFSIGVITQYSTETYDILLDASNLLNNYKDYEIYFLTDSTTASVDYYVNLYLTYDATDDIYKATYEDGEYFVSTHFSFNGYKKYSTFLKEVIYYPLEKISIYRLKTKDFKDYLQLTFYPGVDEYGDFKDGKYIFITDRLGGNRNIAYIDLSNESLNILPVWGSSEYYPKFSPDLKNIVFQGSLHGAWNVYVMPFERDYAKKIKRISTGTAYTPVWYDNENLLYIQDLEKGNLLVKYNLKTRKYEEIHTFGDMVFTPFASGTEIFYTSLNGANFGIYKYIDGENEKVEDTFYNEHDPVIYNDKLIFTSNRDGIYRIWMKDLKTSSVTCLTKDINYDVFYPVISNGLLFFSVYKDNEEPDIFVKKLDF
ncbi:hypothetical protein SU69_07225 [Thermosipho melanesiensis]|uniref:Periplasmic component of the Tol biopolymer transport system-like protein n=2 Tax=Thermosipho melanesiensis TaxID=46541 RepID=A6LMX2_THEM4|nr:hypothetical protein [Thermosipho melanesiensis]ABR31273.1 hypothetical protein Tmel_1426 [Thermosipho melanesiensis BI429]APT74354.1 hypothetical protein BW47_07550 [Thermosipho melanesiensis]OOC36296.1 hypothetical protein SU68_07295 [Thermosipho melanesiensis]OOC37114.1 hypothetical protein SU69_07225 [Thermosipho melanesiensis]OOC37866.1 hypothetical protein SU70_07235 [Thermosipho melanesiensis]